jgi:hypothetical protein
MQVANTLAYFRSATITTIKSFTVQAHGVKPVGSAPRCRPTGHNVLNFLRLQLTNVCKKLVFVSGTPVKPRLRVMSKAMGLLKCGARPTLLANIRLSYTGLPGTNTLARYKHS